MEDNEISEVESEHYEEINSEINFDVDVVKTMVNCQFLCNASQLFQWPIADYFAQLVVKEYKEPKERSWSSERFPIHGNNEAFGQLTLNHSKNSHWTLSLTLELYDRSGSHRAPATDIDSNFVCKYRYKSSPPSSFPDRDTDTCQQLMYFGTIVKTTKTLISWRHYPDRNLQSILIEIYQFSAEIPRYVTSNRNVVVGKIDDFSKRARDPIMEAIPRINFGSTGGQQMVVSFKNNPNKQLLLFSSTLNFIKDRKESCTSVAATAFEVTFTIFSEKRYLEDFVKRIVVLSGEKKEEKFEHLLSLTFYEDISKMLVDDVMYYKVVLEPVFLKKSCGCLA